MKRTVLNLASFCLFFPAPLIFGQTEPQFKGRDVVPVSVPADHGKWVRMKEGVPFPPHPHLGTLATPTPPGMYVAIGDSITFGTGITDTCTTYPDHPVDIEEYCTDHFGKSYAERVAYALRDQRVAGRFMNLGIAGATTGVVISRELPWLPADATIITLYIGTNDSRDVRVIGSVDATVDNFKKGYAIILDYIHSHAPKAKVILINVPNQKLLGGVAHPPADVLEQFGTTTAVMDRYINQFYPQYPVVDLACKSFSYDSSLRYNGSVHPNDAGAAQLAEEVLKVALDKDSVPPDGHCSWLFDKSK